MVRLTFSFRAMGQNCIDTHKFLMQDDYGGCNEILHTLSDISETLKKSEEDDIRSMEG